MPRCELTGSHRHACHAPGSFPALGQHLTLCWAALGQHLAFCWAALLCMGWVSTLGHGSCEAGSPCSSLLGHL